MWSWLGALLEAVSGIIPVPVLVRSNQHGVYFRGGKDPKLTPKRALIYLPILEQIHVLPAHEYSAEPVEQTLTFLDGQEITIWTDCLYRISDPVKLMAKCDDNYEAIICYLVSASVSHVASERTYGEETLDSISEAIQDELGPRLAKRGIELMECQIVRYSKSRTLNHTGISVSVG